MLLSSLFDYPFTYCLRELRPHGFARVRDKPDFVNSRSAVHRPDIFFDLLHITHRDRHGVDKGVLQRQKDFAVLRALGARKSDIFIVVLVQSLMIAAVGIGIGFLLLALFLNGTLDSSLPTYLPRWMPPALGCFTLILCVAGSLLAIRKATAVEPASVFR